MRSLKKSAVIIGILLGTVFWILETALEVFIFKIATHGFIHHIFFPNLHELWMRILLVVCIILIVIYIYSTTERRTIEEKLRKAAITDDLTGLLNRRGFFTLAEHQCELATRRNSVFALIYLDVDGLKTINDELGHDAGDQALLDAAEIFKKTFRKSDIIARIGGDEFAVLLSELHDPDAEGVIVQHLQDNITKHNEIGLRSYELLISYGVTHFNPETPCSISKLLNHADELMYRHKNLKKS